MGTLFLVGTPIGNLEDISERVLRVLRQVQLIAAEDPSRTQRLLSRYHIHTPMMRFTDAYDRRKQSRMRAVLDALTEGDVALVTEAGMPGLADPGYELISAALERGIHLVGVPGPTAVSAALAISGIPGDRFFFVGFLPRATSARRALFASLVDCPLTLVAYEVPHRLLDTLTDLEQWFGDRFIAACSELTKHHEQVQRGTPSELLTHFRAWPPRGEFTLVISGAAGGRAFHPVGL